MIGKTINNYVLERKLGDGGMGEVYFARHNKVDREVAIKILYSHLFNNEDIHNRFKNEANALIKLNHPNIVKIFDYVEHENYACLIMEYINGYTLDDYISKISGPLSSERVISVICPILDAVQYAHDKNIYHRDIKPSNIMISKDGTIVRIMDFGIAKLADSKNYKTTHANTQLGTPFYMSPEQIKGMPFARTSDIYSLGVTLFEMVTGQCPYHNINSLFELQSQIVNHPLPLTDDFYPGVSPHIQNTIQKATQKTPGQRFQNCSEFSEYLRKENASTPVPPVKLSKESDSGHIENNIPKLAIFSIVGLIIFVILLLIFIKIFNAPTPLTTQPVPEYATTTSITSNGQTNPEKSNFQDEVPKQQELSVSVNNLNLLETYFTSKEKKYSIISLHQKDKIIAEVSVLEHLVSLDELSSKYDRDFTQIPSKDQILNDFWQEIHQKKELCRILFEKDSQLTKIRIEPFKPDRRNPPELLNISVRFWINPVVDFSEIPEKVEPGGVIKTTQVDKENDKVPCNINLKYIKNGNRYQKENEF